MSKRGNAILFSEMTPGDAFAKNFHDWYDHEHIPVRMNAPGFRSARRYARVEGAGFLAVYELDSPEVLQTERYGEIKSRPTERTRWMLDNVTGFTRYTCESIDAALPYSSPDNALDAAYLYAVAFAVPDSDCEEFDDWYTKEHVPLLMGCPEWLDVRRFKVLSGEPKTYSRLALHYLSSESALSSPERAQARGTEWRARLAQRGWFKGDYAMFKAFGDRQVGLTEER